MSGAPEMPGGVPVPRRVATADVPAQEALAKVHPGVTRLETFFAAVDPVKAGDGDGREVGALGRHRFGAYERRLRE